MHTDFCAGGGVYMKTKVTKNICSYSIIEDTLAQRIHFQNTPLSNHLPLFHSIHIWANYHGGSSSDSLNTRTIVGHGESRGRNIVQCHGVGIVCTPTNCLRHDSGIYIS